MYFAYVLNNVAFDILCSLVTMSVTLQSSCFLTALTISISVFHFIFIISSNW